MLKVKYLYRSYFTTRHQCSIADEARPTDRVILSLRRRASLRHDNRREIRIRNDFSRSRSRSGRASATVVGAQDARDLVLVMPPSKRDNDEQAPDTSYWRRTGDVVYDIDIYAVMAPANAGR